MLVPLGWLHELVDVHADADEIAERLALSGTSVEDVHRRDGEVSDVVVAEVLELSDIPESDKLVVAQVDAGSHGRFQVVAGAKNFAKGDRVPFVRPGGRVTTLPEVGVRTMAGSYESQGMLCSAHELGLSEDHSGIMVLGDQVAVGADVVDLLELDREVIEIEVTPNRPDLLSILGVAREVAVLFGGTLRPPDDAVAEEGPDVEGLASVEIADPDGCPRYLARVIEGVRFGPSPARAQARLAACGMRPLGNLVDATNYVLLLTGQPLHAFDLDTLTDHRIVVRRARSGEHLVTLDDVERELTETDLVIADAADAQALAGVMGGARTEVGERTHRILLESAYFDPITIARSSGRLNLRTEASQRFERGADPRMVPTAASLCAELFRTWAGGTVARGAIDAGRAPERPTLRLRHDRVRTIVGVDVPRSEAEGYLTGLGCDVRTADDVVEVVPPSWRPDLEREIDLIEEVARLHGYDRVPFRVPTGRRGFLTTRQLLERRVRGVLLGAGLSEATLPSFTSDTDLQRIGYEGPMVEVTNPMSSEQGHLRPRLLPGLLHAARRNVAQGIRDVRLFELGTVFGSWKATDDLPSEREVIGIVLCGDAGELAWHTERRPVDVYDVKGVVEVLCDELGIDGWSLGSCERMPFHPGRAATVLVDGSSVGEFGELRPSVAAAFDLEGGAAAIELDLPPLLEAARRELRVQDVPRLPPVLRDIAFVVDEGIAAGDVRGTIEGAGGEHLESAVLLDVYRGDPVPEGRKSLAYRLTFRAPDRTLTAEEADRMREAVAAALREGHGAELR